MRLKTEEVACRLDVPVHTVERWIRQGRIPIRKSGAECLFDQAALERWAGRHHLNFSSSTEGCTQKICTVPDSLSAAMRRGLICREISGQDVKSILEAAVAHVPLPEDLDEEKLYLRLMEREKLTSTGIGKGVAVPHPRKPLAELIESTITTCFLEKPVDFCAVDDRPVFVLFILLSPEIKTHLHLLSRLSYCLRYDDFIRFLQKAPQEDPFFSRIEALERELDGIVSA